MNTIRAMVLGLLPLALLAGGCQTPDPGAIGRYVVKSKNAPFYKYGPAQSAGPDLTLPKGAALSVFRQQMGFAQVVLDNGVSGYVASSDLEPAPDAPREGSASRADERPERIKLSRGGSTPPRRPVEPEAVEEPLGLPVLPDPGLFAPLPSQGEPEAGADLPPAESGGVKPAFRY